MEPLKNILVCPDCRAGLNWKNENSCDCLKCGRIFERNGKFMNLMPSNSWVNENDDYKKNILQEWKKIESEFNKSYVYNGGVSKIVHSWGHNAVEGFRGASHNVGFVLDLACGIGPHLPYFRRNNDEILMCLDIDYNLLDLALHNNNAAKAAIIIQADNYYLPFKDNSIDQVLSIYALEHMDDLYRSLSEVYRVLSNDGYFYAAIPTEGLLWKIGRQLTTARTAKRRFGVTNYNEIVKLNHVSDAKKILDVAKKMFKVEEIKYYPLSVPSYHLNLIVAFKLSKDR